MDLRARILADTKDAMKSKDGTRLSTLRLVTAAIKDREIARRGEDSTTVLTEADLVEILGRMIRQRQESARAYEEGGRLELAEKEQAEIEIIQSYLPRQLDAGEIERALNEIITELGADNIRDMGRVMAELKSRYMGRMDFGAVGPMVRARLM